MTEHHLIFYFLLFFVAFLYASVGHGGASGYLALMAFFSISPDTMKSSALLLNSVVSIIAFSQYFQSGHFKFQLFWPFAITSVPMAFIGGFITIDTEIYKKILAVLLLFPVIWFLGFKNYIPTKTVKPNRFISLIAGTVIGLLSGMIGIGGGIILSPLLLLLHWADMKQTAAVASLFILVNSLGGLGGFLMHERAISSEIYIFTIIAATAGLLGSFLGAKKLNYTALKFILAAVLLIASFKLMFT